MHLQKYIIAVPVACQKAEASFLMQQGAFSVGYIKDLQCGLQLEFSVYSDVHIVMMVLAYKRLPT